MGKIVLPKGLPPAGYPIDGKFGRVGGLTDVHIAAIVGQVIDAVGNCFANGF